MESIDKSLDSSATSPETFGKTPGWRRMAKDKTKELSTDWNVVIKWTG